jgi:hypothetical protein
MIRLLLFKLLSFALLASCCHVAAAQSSLTSSRTAAEVDPPPGIRTLVTRALGAAAEVIRFGHLSDPDSLEVIGAVPAPGVNQSQEAMVVSRLAVFRENGSQWMIGLRADKAIRNDWGLVANPFGNLPASPLYRVSFFQRRFDDGHERFVIQLTPINSAGENIGKPVHVSWNTSIGRYQQISLQGYGFQPELPDEGSL